MMTDTDPLAIWLEKEADLVRELIRGIEQDGWTYGVDKGEGPVDTTATDLAEARERLGRIEGLLTAMKGADPA